jgi:hypothetical protein
MCLQHIICRVNQYLTNILCKNMAIYGKVKRLLFKNIRSIRGIASLFCSASNQTWKRGSGNFCLTRCKIVRSEVFSWVNWIHKQHIDFMVLLDRIYLELPKICSSCLVDTNFSITLSKSTRLKSRSGADPGFVVRGVWVGEGSGDRLRSPAGPRQSPGRGPRGAKPPRSSGGLRNYRHLFERQFWTNHTIFIRPKKLDFES